MGNRSDNLLSFLLFLWGIDFAEIKKLKGIFETRL